MLKKLIYLYFLLIIFEGALRKWVLPGLATPLLVVRDPLLLLIFLLALKEQKLILNGWVFSLACVAILSFFTAMVFGHQNLVVGVYGLRANFLHVPLIFVMGVALDLRDVKFYAKNLLLLSIPMTGLLVWQFSSPIDSFINIGVGGQGTASFSGSGGYYRSSGTFSFITGVVAFYSLAFALWTSTLITKEKMTKGIVLISGAAILLAIPTSISRSLLVSVCIILVGLPICFSKMGFKAGVLQRFFMLGGLGLLLVSQLDFFDIATGAFSSRWEESTTTRGGVEEAILGRILESTLTPLLNVGNYGFWGNGIGAGTIGGSVLLGNEARAFLGGEWEWQRILWEMGFLLGAFYVLYRLKLVFDLLKFSYNKLNFKNPYPWILFLSVAPMILIGQWGQPTQLGFAVFGGGLILASAKTNDDRVQ